MRNRSSDYLIDRDEQKHRSYTGVRGVAEQDQMVWERQGYIADRSKECLSRTDIGIVHFRRVMLDGARALCEGVAPSAASRPQAYRLLSGGAVESAGLSFEKMMRRRFGSASGLVP